jgi:hypothetical protein
MSLHDHIDEAFFGDEEERAERDQYLDAFASLIDSTKDPHALGRLLLCALAVEAALALSVVFRPGFLIEYAGEYLLLIPFLTFGLGFFIAFSLYRMYEQTFDRGEKKVEIDRGIMSGYSGYDARSRYYVIWFVAAAGAILNVALIAILGLSF